MATAALIGPTATSADAATRTFTAINVTADGQGYKITSDRGESYDFGGVTPRPNPTGFSERITDVAVTADGRGTLALSDSGQFYAYGTAHPWPNPTGFSGDMVAVAMTADGQGAVAMSDHGQLYAYGTARPWRNPTGYDHPMVDVSLTADGQGLLAVSRSGQFYAYGTARPQQNPTGFRDGIRAAALTADGRGLLAVSGAGEFYAYGTAHAWPNPTGFTGGIVDLAVTADGQGAIAVSGTGQTYVYGSVVPRGNADPGTSPSASRSAELARTLLEMRARGQIRVADYSARPSADRRDRSLASQQLRDVADGDPARLSSRCANLPRPTTQPDTRVLQFLVDLGQARGYSINSLFGQCHSTGSLHYSGRAVDFACGLDTAVADRIGRAYGVRRNSETCASDGHWHYSVGGR